MGWFFYLRSIAARFFRRSQIENDLEEELRAHIEARTDDLMRSGLSRNEAERHARIEFGGRERFKDECREELGGNFMDTLVADVRYSLRVLRKSPGFTIVAVLTLALAIGANAVVFGVLNALILRPLSVPRDQSLYMVEQPKGAGYLSYPDYVDLRDRNRSFEGLAAYNLDQVGFDKGGDPTRAWAERVSGNYFDVLGIEPYVGRVFHASDERGPNSAPYVVLTYAYWHVHFQDDRNVAGRVVQLNKHPFTIIGVAPPSFHGTLLFFTPDFFMPLVNQEQVSGENILNARSNRVAILASLGHLKAGVTPEQAVADLNSIGAYLEKTYPKDDGSMTFRLSRPSLYGNLLGPPVKAFITGLMLLAALILLAACANMGSLFAARASDRSRETALRLALGAKRSRVLRALFTESILLSIAGGALGLWCSVELLRLLSAWQPVPRFPFNLPVTPDANVYIVALALAIVSGFLFGMVPVRQVLNTNPYEVVKAGMSSTAGRRVTARDVLLVVQIAICAVLVTSSFVAVRGLMRSLHSRFGFDANHVLVMNTRLRMAGYQGDAVLTMQKRMIAATEAIGGVESVGLADWLPLSGGFRGSSVFHDETTDFKSSNAVDVPYTYSVSTDYFRAASTSLLAGRAFTPHDDSKSERVGIVNLTFARKVFGSPEKAIGRYFKLGDASRIQVVGLVEDGKYLNLTESATAALFVPILQWPAVDTWMIVRSHGDPRQVARALKDSIRGLDSGLPVYLSTWPKELEFALFPSRIATVSLGVLGLIGAVLAAIGIFGMAAYTVSKRLREIGIRLALGASRKEVLQTALSRALRLFSIGAAAGLVLGLLATRVLASIVYQATPRDPVVLAGVVLALLALSSLATWIPAQRALSVDPMTLLREE